MRPSRLASSLIRLCVIVTPLALLFLVASFPSASAAQPMGLAQPPDVDALADDAYVYGYPAVLMHVTQRVLTNVPRPIESPAIAPLPLAPVNQLARMRAFPTLDQQAVVRLNRDTLYTSAWLDLAAEPMVLHVPSSHGRFYLVQMIDAYTNVLADPGSRTLGDDPHTFAIVGPHWQGRLPAELTRIDAPTDTVWIAGRIQTDGENDFAQVHAIQDEYRLAPLSRSGDAHIPPANLTFDLRVNMRTTPMKQLAQMDAATFYAILAEQLTRNPPPARDAPILRRLAKLGLVPGKPFDLGKANPAVAQALAGSVKRGQERIARAIRSLGREANGWRILPNNVGQFGTDYDARAAVAQFALGANLAADAVYPSTLVDSEGRALNGEHRYVLHFAAGHTPPARAFWSLTLYDADGFLIDNPAHRYIIRDRDPLEYNPDGSLDLWIQRESPGHGHESNWLPMPAGGFSLTLRIYWPEPEVLSGDWKPPGVKRLD